ncbi:FHA domain-containing protein [Tropicimonas marinistellae]|uniref:FHA domain-containing protein n=1 Tax=Tropicimonas marinistellae TaxID=1739787 RepID=UPI00082ADB88|nr:FHA domain-containing protein [Tropicimonas marinistellae]
MQTAILIVDVTGSTPLYVQKGDEIARQTIDRCLSLARRIADAGGGHFISSKGDDVLYRFDAPDAAFAAARRIMADAPVGGLRLHAGLCSGEVIRERDDAFGLTVIRAARLSALAQPGEILLDGETVDRLDAAARATLVRIGPVMLKGIPEPVRVHAYRAMDAVQLTEAAAVGQPLEGRAQVMVVIRSLRGEQVVREGVTVTLGRAEDCDVVMSDPWVSRRHATISVMQGVAELVDHSSAGTFLAFQDGRRLDLLRRNVTLAGSGRLSLGMPPDDPRAQALRFDVVPTD